MLISDYLFFIPTATANQDFNVNPGQDLTFSG